MKLSVIIPVYNAEKFLRRTVESVLQQMDGQVELILVNDGSTDGSGALCDELAGVRPHVKVIHKANGGPCTARNAGMKAASGEYMTFLDSDDYLDPTACRQILDVIDRHHPDCMDFGWNYVNQNGEITHNTHKLPKDVLLGMDVIRNTILPPMLHLWKDEDHFIFDFSCAKVYRRQIVMEHGVFFDEGRRTWEDRPFVIQYLKYCRNYYAMGNCLYYYIFMEGSLSQRYSVDYFRIILVTFRQYLQDFEDIYDFRTQYVQDHWCGAIESMIYRSLEQTRDRDLIRQTILQTLADEQVVTWYRNRKPKEEFDKNVSALVVSGNGEAALAAYEKRAKQIRRKRNKDLFLLRLKGKIKRILRK